MIWEPEGLRSPRVLNWNLTPGDAMFSRVYHRSALHLRAQILSTVFEEHCDKIGLVQDAAQVRNRQRLAPWKKATKIEIHQFHLMHVRVLPVLCPVLAVGFSRVIHFPPLLSHTMLRLLSFKTQGCKDFWKPFKPCHVGIHWIALLEYSQMSTLVPGFWSFYRICASFCMAN